ncbi:MAG: YdcF family protein [Planctomycetes bacterium]|nr:YdcF family protein [Planctomycetota bacterium]
MFSLTRPFGVALAVFILLNLSLALQNPLTSATRIWLNIQLPEPALSIFCGILGLALLLPHDAARAGWVRWMLAGVIFGFCILVGANVIGYYHRLYNGQFTTSLPVPFSAAPLAILLAEFGRVSWWSPIEPKLPPPAWCFVSGILINLAFFFLIFVHIVTFGHTDYRTVGGDAAVILGAKVMDDGSLCSALQQRVDTGVDLYRRHLVPYLIMSGGTGANGLSEAEYMARYAHDHGVPLSRIILDNAGDNTRLSARNCGQIARERGFKSLLTVSQHFHCARIKLIFEREGTPCYTVPAGSLFDGTRLLREKFYLLREVLAFPFYYIYYR